MTQPKCLNAKSIDHLTLVVADIDLSRKFYVDLLGMSEVPRPEFSFPGAWFQLGNTQIHITLSDANSGQAGWGDRQVGRVSRGHHFAFQVNDMDQAIAILNEHEIRIVDGPKSRPDGPTQVYVRDPDNHLIELFSI